jgi:hypothetical protein
MSQKNTFGGLLDQFYGAGTDTFSVVSNVAKAVSELAEAGAVMATGNKLNILEQEALKLVENQQANAQRRAELKVSDEQAAAAMAMLLRRNRD